MSHTCKAPVLHCMDFRFHTAIRDYLVSIHLKDAYDCVSLAGATKSLAEGDTEATHVILKQVDISLQLHGISDIYLIHHMDCGAYGGHAAFSSEEAEKQQHVTDMQMSRKQIQIAHPQLQIHLLVARIQEQGHEREISFEDIQ